MPCIFDVYDQSLTRHETLLREWEARQRASPVESHAPVAGAELYYRSLGEGPPLVVIHGGPDFDHKYLLPDIDRLADRHRVILYDQRGRGRTRGEVRLEDIRIETYVEDLEGLRRHLGLETMAVMGHSWGGIVAMHYALAHPERLTQLVLLNTAPATHDDLVLMREERMRRRLGIVEQLGAFTAGYEVADPAAVAQFYHLDFGTSFARPADAARLDLNWTREQILAGRAIEDKLQEGLIWSPGYTLLPRLGSIRTPTLVIHGARDFIPRASDERIAGAIPGAHLVVLEGSGHFSYMDAPEAVRETLAAFLLPHPGHASVTTLP
jgi:proline iminopeptidase